ncbi:hypothetical protein [Eubacterium sp. 1001713B170207_170306_E7]|uniref:hypothetical protein n=1 Tax=Eubacterium sp. 1001713B170207_170306_E7 TaxID=2787097 RepID=UPI0018984A65|nr:hypothetical protein [Eubacterium sp. 1001713B170207_170306_E7]
MRALSRSFSCFIRQIAADRMLILVCAAPLFCGIFFRFGLPAMEPLLIQWFGFGLKPYYLLMDLFLSSVTPYMLCFVSAMVILSEADSHMSTYLCVTPIGKKGYLASRLVFPAALSALASFFVLAVFRLAVDSVLLMAGMALQSAILGMLAAMLIVSLASNKVEGMAISKLSGLILFGMVVPFVLKGNEKYFFSLLPSFWIAQWAVAPDIYPFLLFIVTSVLCFWALWRRFALKLT